MKTNSTLRSLFLIVLFIIGGKAFSQMSYYQDLFAGGVTGAGYSPDYFQTAPVTGVCTVNIAPGSTIRNAYLIVGRLGNAPATNITLNGSPITLNAGNQVSPTFNTLYGGASGVHVVNVTGMVSAAVNVYSIGLPAQSSTSNRYQDYYLYIAYNNAILPSVATSIFLNTQNAANIMNWGTLTMLWPFNTASGDVGYSFFGGYECGNGDGEQPIINGTNLGIAWGQDINSGQCGGPVGSFFYNSGVLNQLSDDNVNQAVAGPEALSRINALVTNGSNTLTLSHQHQSAGGQDNHPWGAIFVWNSCTQPTVTAVATSTSICPGQTTTLTAGGANTYTWNPGNIAGISAAVSPTATTIYTVTGMTPSGCSNTKTINIVVNPLPSLTVTPTPTAICIGNSATLTAAGAASYTWNPGSLNGTNITVSPAATTVYTVTGQSAAGCINTKTVSLTVNPLPVVNPTSNSPVCIGGTLSFTLGAASTYTWSGPTFASNLQNPNIVNVSAANAGTYSVSVTNAQGCVGTGSTNVVISPLPVITPTNTGPYCVGSTINLSVGAATSYTWSGPAFASNLQNPSIVNSQTVMAGVYSVTVTNAGGCKSSGTTNLVVNPNPTVMATSNSPVCVGGPINFTGGGGGFYSWAGPGAFASNQQNPTISMCGMPNNGNNTLTVTDANGCKSSTVITVVVNPLPVIAVTNPTTCLNTTLNLSANGGSTYAWSGPLGFNSALQNPTLPNATIPMSGPYSVTVTTAAGCFSTSVSNATVYALPNPNIVSNSPVCSGGTLTLSGSGGATYQWFGPGYSGPQQNPIINNVTVGASGVYTLVASASTCSASTTASITINPLPIPVMNSTSPVCIGQPINFTGNGGVSYSWAGPGFISPVQNPSIPVSALSNTGTFTLTVTDANNCVNKATINVVVNPQPIVAATGTLVCENGTTNLTANGGVSYSWNGPAGFNSNAQNPTIANAQLNYSGQYTVVVTNANSCTNTAVANLAVTPAPIPNIQTNSPICINNILSLNGSGGVSYAWTGPNGFFSTSQTPTINANSTAFTGNYQVTVTDANGCFATTAMGATVNPTPNVFVTASNDKGCPPLCVTFTATSSSSVSAYNWTLGDGSSGTSASTQACYNKTGTYTVNANVTDVNGCVNSTTHTVSIYPHPVADFNYAPYLPIASLDDVNFTDASYGAPVVAWTWYFMNTAQYTSNIQNPTFIYSDHGDYAVALVVKSDAGCLDTVVKTVQVGEDFGVFVPNGFTPNGDGLNDLFYAKGFGVKKFEMEIYDRWGEKIFVSNDMNDAWDGSRQSNGLKTIEEGAYTWRIKMTNVNGKAKELTGHVTLIK